MMMKTKSIYEDILTIACGQDENGVPNSASGIITADLKKDGIMEEIFLYAPVEIYASAEAAVCIFDFEEKHSADFQKAAAACIRCLLEDDKVMALKVVPLLLNGTCEVTFTGLFHVDLYTGKKRGKRLLLCFESHDLNEGEETDLDVLRKQIENDFDRQIKDLDHTADELEEKLREITSGQNDFDYEPYTGELEEENEIQETGVRFVPDEA